MKISNIYNLLAAVYSVLLVYFYAGGDLLDYRNFYDELNSYNFIGGYIYYTAMLGASEPVYYLVSFIFSNFGVPHVVFISVLNFLLILSYLKNFDGHRRFGLLMSFFMLVGFHFSMLFTELERLKVGFIFIFFAFQHRSTKWRYAFLISGVLSHLSLAALLLVQLVMDVLNPNGMKLKINFIKLLYGIAVVVSLLSITYGPLMAKLAHYSRSVDYLSFAEAFLITTYFALLTKRNRPQILILGIILMLLAPIMGGGRFLILALPLFFIWSMSAENAINKLFLLPIGVYYAFRGAIFFYNTIETGRGIIV